MSDGGPGARPKRKGRVEVTPGRAASQLALEMQQQAIFEVVPFDSWFCTGPGVKMCMYRRWFSRPANQICTNSHEHCESAEDGEVLHGVSFAAAAI